jgi:hypothetical protein
MTTIHPIRNPLLKTVSIIHNFFFLYRLEMNIPPLDIQKSNGKIEVSCTVTHNQPGWQEIVETVARIFFEFSSKKAERLVMDLGFVDFGDYFGRFLIQNWGVIYENRYCPPISDRKLGSKEPQNRLKPNPLTVSEQREDAVLRCTILRTTVSPLEAQGLALLWRVSRAGSAHVS